MNNPAGYLSSKYWALRYWATRYFSTHPAEAIVLAEALIIRASIELRRSSTAFSASVADPDYLLLSIIASLDTTMQPGPVSFYQPGADFTFKYPITDIDFRKHSISSETGKPASSVSSVNPDAGMAAGGELVDFALRKPSAAFETIQ